MPASRLLALVVGAVLAYGVWTVAIPLAGTPDGRQHVVWAAALWQGQFAPEDHVEANGDFRSTESDVEVPAAYADLAARYRCFWTNNPTREGCVLALEAKAGMAAATTRAGRYPPAYYLAVGAPLRAADPVVGIGGARVLSAVLTGLTLAAGLVVAARRRRHALIALAVTPYALYLGALVNPSGWEIASAATLTLGLLALGDRSPDDRAAADVVVALALGGTGLLLARPLGPAFVLLAVAVAALVADHRVLVAGLRDRRVRAVGAWLGAAFVFAVGWYVWRDPSGALAGTPAPDLSTGDVIGKVVRLTPAILDQMVWNAVGFPPDLVRTLWVVVAGVGVLGAVAVGRSRQRLGLGLALAAVFGLPFVGVLQAVGDIGIEWQGRYSQPLAAVAIASASWVVSGRLDPAVRRWTTWALVAGAGAVQTWSVLAHVANRMAWPDAPAGLLVDAVPDRWSPAVAPLALGFLMLVAWGLLGYGLDRDAAGSAAEGTPLA